MLETKSPSARSQKGPQEARQQGPDPSVVTTLCPHSPQLCMRSQKYLAGVKEC